MLPLSFFSQLRKNLARQKGKHMSKVQLEFLAKMIVNGQAVLVKRNGKLVPASKI